MNTPQKERVSVIREGLVVITGDFKKAVILNQLIYWAERVSDYDQFIEQENKRAAQYGYEETEPTCGWLYKSADDLNEETMLGLSRKTIRACLKDLVSAGFISERTNPKYNWDKTIQYRVNLATIARTLKEKGFALNGYRIDFEVNVSADSTDMEEISTSNENKQAVRCFKNDHGCFKNDHGMGKNETAIPETITETTTESNNIYPPYPLTESSTSNGSNQAKRDSKPAKEPFADLIEQYSNGDAEVKELINAWLQNRKAKRSPTTEKAVELNLKKMHALARESNMTIVDYLEAIVARGWTAFYAIRDNGGYKTQRQPYRPAAENKGTLYGRTIDEMGYDDPINQALSLDLSFLEEDGNVDNDGE